MIRSTARGEEPQGSDPAGRRLVNRPQECEKDWEFFREIWAFKLHTFSKFNWLILPRFPRWNWEICRDQGRPTFYITASLQTNMFSMCNTYRPQTNKIDFKNQSGSFSKAHIVIRYNLLEFKSTRTLFNVTLFVLLKCSGKFWSSYFYFTLNLVAIFVCLNLAKFRDVTHKKVALSELNHFPSNV